MKEKGTCGSHLKKKKKNKINKGNQKEMKRDGQRGVRCERIFFFFSLSFFIRFTEI